MKKVLICGESYFGYTIHIKGADTMETTGYHEQVGWLKDALINSGYEVSYLPNHEVVNGMPSTVEGLSEYDLIILSDVGANTLMMPDRSFQESLPTPDRCNAIKEYVEHGGSLVLVGGFMSFTGIEGKARYGMTPIADILPVDLLTYDDRVEISSGIVPMIKNIDHPIFKNMSSNWKSYFIGYNKTIENITKGEVLATINGDPFIAVSEINKGKVVVFTSDCAPHWAPQSFLDSPEYRIIWKNIADWATNK
ncbi:MAG: cytoplasmic protein [Clostridiaceae bacterium]|jgi:uncharacterized membrane protein|nr:glutamine amidotransferase [Bacillota bacterium]NLN52621.1 cytoplasmic protein [Clostridiaceae bacterium]